MQAAARRYLTIDEYFAFDEESEIKYEYFQGEVFAMSGGTARHSTIQFNLIGLFHGQLKSRTCRGYTSDFRVHVEEVGLYTYPDLSVVCGETRLEGQRALLNPTALFEVLSPSTEAYDRGAKFAMYRQIESLKQYVLIAQDRCCVEVFTRQTGGSWRFEEFTTQDASVTLETIGCTLSLAELYENVEFPPRPGLHPTEEPPDTARVTT